jgi:hypothetical protein
MKNLALFLTDVKKILILFIVELLLYLTSVNIYDSLITTNVDMLFV